ncbi:hypothetical protein SRABI112_01244 [Pseudomonas mediterranea]|nr:hypothetical protein SRABI112_01244 [Pseudomonas mediterranea]
MSNILWAFEGGSKQGRDWGWTATPFVAPNTYLWRGDLSPLGRAAALSFWGRYAAQRG